MLILRTWAPAAATLLLAACASVPQQQVSISGVVPAGSSYAPVQPIKDAPPLAAWPGLEACLGSAGLMAVSSPAAAPQVLAQAAYALRPARASILRPGEVLPPKGHRPGRNRDHEELVLTLTDRTRGAVLWRGAVTRLLGKGETAGEGTALVAPLCAALKTGPAAIPG